MHHDLKILPAFFDLVAHGSKTFEIRKNDRGYEPGDTIELREYDLHRNPPGYTGRACSARIGFVTSFAQQPGVVVFSLLGLEQPSGVPDAGG